MFMSRKIIITAIAAAVTLTAGIITVIRCRCKKSKWA